MAYPLIILGAGASYDAINIEQYTGTKKVNLERFRPPLTRELFSHSREIYQTILEKHSRVNSLAAQVLPRLEDGKFTFEEILQGFLDAHKKGAENRQERVIRELISLSYYLAELFTSVSNNFFEGDNNYIRLITEMNNHLIKSYVINFNYDLIFEHSAGKDLSSIDEYINGDVKILKIHGACNWVYAPVTNRGNTYTNAEDFFADKADTYFDFFKNIPVSIRKSTSYLEKVENGIGRHDALMYMPAVAVPLNKKTLHVCPATHIENFDNDLGSFDRVIIIGWRGTDSFITNKLKEKLGEKRLTTFIVANKPNVSQTNEKEISDAKTTIREQYKDISQLNILDENIYLGGFSSFMRNHSNYSRLFDDPLPAIMS